MVVLLRNFAFLLGLVFTVTVQAAPGSRIGFTIDQSGSVVNQAALVQDGRVFIENSGGDPYTDLIYDARSRELFIVNHQTKSYYLINDSVIDKAASMIESLSEVAESQQGVLSDLLGTLGISGDEEAEKVRIVKTETMLQAAGVNCRLIQQYRNDKLETEVCIAPRDTLSALGADYATMESFYRFGDRLLSKANAILTNMGIVIPDLHAIEDEDGLPIMAYIWSSATRVLLQSIVDSTVPDDQFRLPQGYVQTPIPFIG